MKKIDHIGIAVRNISESRHFYERILGLKFISEEIIQEQFVKVAMFECGESRLELLEPISEDSPITKYLSKHGSGIHHLAIQVENIEGELQNMKQQNIQLIDEFPKKGAGGHLIAFVHPKGTDGVLIELVESFENNRSKDE